jgi:hypothetical protein
MSATTIIKIKSNIEYLKTRRAELKVKNRVFTKRLNLKKIGL